VADRIAVMFRGRVVHTAKAKDATQEEAPRRWSPSPTAGWLRSAGRDERSPAGYGSSPRMSMSCALAKRRDRYFGQQGIHGAFLSFKELHGRIAASTRSRPIPVAPSQNDAPLPRSGFVREPQSCPIAVELTAVDRQNYAQLAISLFAVLASPHLSGQPGCPAATTPPSAWLSRCPIHRMTLTDIELPMHL